MVPVAALFGPCLIGLVRLPGCLLEAHLWDVAVDAIIIL